MEWYDEPSKIDKKSKSGRYQITIDIETLPGDTRPSNEDLMKEIPKNISKPETIQKWLEENRELSYRKQSLNSMQGQILCIGIKVNNNKTYCPILGDPNINNELDLLNNISEYILELNCSQKDIFWIGHNVYRFDLTWIWRKCIRYNLYELASLIPRNSKSKQIYDIMDMWASEYKDYISLDKIAKFLGYDGKSDSIDGSMVYDYYMEGKIEDIRTYCISDVELEHTIYNQISKGME